MFLNRHEIFQKTVNKVSAFIGATQDSKMKSHFLVIHNGGKKFRQKTKIPTSVHDPQEIFVINLEIKMVEDTLV